MPEKSILRRFEEDFGKIRSKNHAQFLTNSAKAELVRRKQELLKELETKIKVIIDPINRYNFIVKIEFDDGTLLAGAFCNRIENDLYLNSLTVGEFHDFANQIFKSKSSLRYLNIGTLIMNKLIELAKQKNVKYIKGNCSHNLYFIFYKKFGFEIISDLKDGSYFVQLSLR